MSSRQSVFGQIAEQLIMFDATGNEIVPWLASGWEWVDDKTLRIKLREGIKFTNGEVFDSKAAKYSLDMVGNNPEMVWIVQGSFDRTEIVDDYTVDLFVTGRAGAWLAILARNSFVVPPDHVEDVGIEAFANQPIGTGPYMLKEWIRDDHITLEANKDYWGGPPPMDQIVFKVIPEEGARLAALEIGEVDLITNISSSSVKRIGANPETVLSVSPGLRLFATFFHELDYVSPVQDKLVRQALNYAVDKEGLVELQGGFATVMSAQWLAPSIYGFNEDIQPYPYDPEKAKELLAEAGYPDGFDIRMGYTVGRYAMDKEMGEAVAAYLGDVGVRAEQIAVEPGEFFRLIQAGEMGPLQQWGALTPPDPCTTLGIFAIGSEMRRFGERGNDLDDLLYRVCEVTDRTEQNVKIKPTTETMADDPPGIYLTIPDDIYGIRSNVKSFQPRIDQVLWLHDVYKTDM